MEKTLVLARPPVVLMHGLWSDSKTWTWRLLSDTRFVVYSEDYGGTNDKRFSVNVGRVRDGVKTANNILRKRGFASTKVDVVGHSMGGLLARIHVSGVSNFRDDNFQSGDVHKLITLDTPHLGSPLAEWLVTKENSILPLGKAWRVTGRCADCGAVRDLRPDSISMALPLFSQARVPSHAIVGKGGSDLVEAGLELSLESIPEAKFMWQIVEWLKFFGVIDSIFPPRFQHDLFVGRLSQEGGLGTGSNYTSVVSFDLNPLKPSFGLHLTVTKERATEDIVMKLLRAKVSDERFAPNGFPRPPIAIAPAAPEVVFEVLDGGVVVASPAAGTPVRSGATVTLRAVGANGFLPAAVLFVTPFGNKSALTAPFEADLVLPKEAAGTMIVMALGKDATGNLAQSTAIEVPVEIPATLTGISVTPGSLTFESYLLTKGLHVTGHYDDGVDRDLTLGGAGSQYAAIDNRVASIDESGLITALRVGATAVTVSSGNFTIQVPVTVETAKGDVSADGVVGPDDLQAFATCYSGPTGAPGFNALTLACGDSFDFDSDADVDILLSPLCRLHLALGRMIAPKMASP